MSFLAPQPGLSTADATAASRPVYQPMPSNLLKSVSGALPAVATSLQTFGALKSGIDQSNADRYNANAYASEGAIAARQGSEQEAQQRRQGATVMGREVAAAGTAGAGYGGSAGRAMAQSALNTELDALNIRYKSQLQRWSYATQAQNLKDEASTARTGGFLRAGAALLTGYSKSYQSV